MQDDGAIIGRRDRDGRELTPVRALVMHPNQFVLEERPLPQPGPGQVLARTLACGICGSDLHLYRHAEAMLELGRQAGIPEEILDKGVVLGHEFIAEIAGFGPDTRQQLAIGDRVTSIPLSKASWRPYPWARHPGWMAPMPSISSCRRSR